MLCPSCGANVGEEVKLCERCEAARNVKPEVGDDGVNVSSAQAGASGTHEIGDALRTNIAPPAGFWLRFFGLLIDNFVIGLITLLIGFLMEKIPGLSGLGDAFESLLMNSASAGISATKTTLPAVMVMGILLLVALTMLSFASGWLYYALLESSPLRGTLGKLAFGLQVTDLSGHPVSFLKATARFFYRGSCAIPILVAVLVVAIVGRTVSYGSAYASLIFFVVVVSLILGFALFILTFVMVAFTQRKQALHDILAGCLVTRRHEYAMGRYVVTAIGAVILAVLTPRESVDRDEMLYKNLPGKEIGTFEGSNRTIEADPRWQEAVKEVDALTADSRASDSKKEIDQHTATQGAPEASESNPPIQPASSASHQEPEEKTVTPLERVAQHLSELSDAPFGYTKAGTEEVRFHDQLAFYYPRYQRLEVGFYSESLSAEQKEQIRKNREMSASANIRRPTVVVALPLDQRSKGLSADNLLEFSVQLYRDFDTFSFPGDSHFIEFRRKTSHALNGEIPKLTGSLQEGGKIEAKILGTRDHKSTKTTFEWGLVVETTVMEIR